MLDDKIFLDEFKRVQIIEGMFFDHKRIKSESISRKKSERFTKTW